MAILSLGICPKCGNATDTTARYCEHCAADLGEIRRPVHPTPDQQAKQTQTKTEEASEVKSLKKRYWDAYVVARTTVGIGTAIKVIGAILGILIFLGALVFANNQPRYYRASEAQVVAVIVGGVWGVLVWLIFFIAGVLVSAQGQILKASLDGAVNSSPFLTDQQRAKIMSL